MPQDLNSYQVYIIRELSKTPKEFKDILHSRELWLMTNIEYTIERLLSWEIEMLLDDFIIIEDDLLLSNIIKNSKYYNKNLTLKLTNKAKEYMSLWSSSNIVKRKLSDRIISLNKALDEKKNGTGQSNSYEFSNKNEKLEITIAAYGIMHVYIKFKEFNGQGVTEQNKKELAAKYGYTSPTSGKQLKDEYDNFNNDKLATPREHLKRLKSILPILEHKHPTAFEAVKRDIDEVTKKIRKF